MRIASTIAWYYQKIFHPRSLKFHAAEGKRAAIRYRRKVATPEGHQSLQQALGAYHSAMKTIPDAQKPTPKIAKTQAKYQATAWLVYQLQKDERMKATTSITRQDSGVDGADSSQLLSSTAKLGREARLSWEGTNGGLMDEGVRFVSLLVWTTTCIELQREMDAREQNDEEPFTDLWGSLLARHELPPRKILDSLIDTNKSKNPNALLHPPVLKHIKCLAMALVTGDLKNIPEERLREGLVEVIEKIPPVVAGQ